MLKTTLKIIPIMANTFPFFPHLFAFLFCCLFAKTSEIIPNIIPYNGGEENMMLKIPKITDATPKLLSSEILISFFIQVRRKYII